MELQVSQTYSDSYGKRSESVRAVASQDKFLERIIDIHSTEFFIANSVVSVTGKWWWKKYTHVLLLDCDGTGEMLAACNMLASMKIGYGLIQSSPSRYWIVTDKLGTFHDLYLFVHGIPGVDRNYIEMAAKYQRFFLRLVPFGGKMAMFAGSDNLREPLAKQWYDDFELLWNTPQVKQRHRAEILKAKVEDGSIIAAAADPEFQL